MLAAGTLIHRLTVQTRTEISDDHGGFTEVWAAVQSRIAGLVTPLGVRDLGRAQQIDPRASHEVSLRFWRAYRDDLASGRARLIWHDGTLADRTLEIIGLPRETVHRETLMMTCKEQG